MTIFEAGVGYRAEGGPVVVVAGKEDGTGSARDGAAKATQLLGVTAVIAESLERIHRSNLIGMGVLPLQFQDGVTRKTLTLDGSEVFDILGLADGVTADMEIPCRITRQDGSSETVMLVCRLDTAFEVTDYPHRDLLPSVSSEATSGGNNGVIRCIN